MSDVVSADRDLVEGLVDSVEPDAIRGWAWMPGHPQDALVVELVDGDGRIIAHAEAANYRGDLEGAGKRGGACGFEIRIPPDALGVFQLRGRRLEDHGDPATVLASEIVLQGRDVSDWGPDLRLGGATEIVGWLDRAGAEAFSGWAYGPGEFVEPLTLALVEGERVLATTVASQWRNDLEDLRQGDGRCGFRFELPSILYDDGEHRLDLRLTDGRSLLTRPLDIRFPAIAPAQPEPVPIQRPPEDAPLAFTIIVNFYNMEREAARTLMSLSRRFQAGVEGIAYEVLAVDNGSDPPLREDFVAEFGPEFRLFRPSVVHASPCAALNEAARQAKGRWIAMMIDGAHIVSPGTLSQAHAALTDSPRAAVALRQWFIGGDQRWFSSVGYSRAVEDVMFAKIDWPNEGYGVFQISAPMFESPNSWFDGMSESNCLFLSAELYEKIGGYDEAFDTPGAGFANLDLFRRASEVADEVIALVGEASFHQYHGGTTTNVGDVEKDARVRAYARQYAKVRGGAYVNRAPENIRLFGSIRTGLALTARQRPFCPARVGVTDRVRPREAADQFDEEAQSYLVSAYIETGRHLATRWRGEAVGVSPTDLTDIQEAMWRAKPQVVIADGLASGLVGFVASVLPMLGLEDTRIVWVSRDEALAAAVPRVDRIVEPSASPAAQERLLQAIGAAEHVLVLFQPPPDDALPIEAIARHALNVTFASYLIVVGVAVGQPWLGYSRAWTAFAINRFLASGAGGGFVIDRTMNQHMVTSCPQGFLRRVLKPLPLERYDTALDDLSGF